MKIPSTHKTILRAALAFAALAPALARAGDNSPTMGWSGAPNGETNRPPLAEVSLDGSYTGSGKAKFQGVKTGKSDAYNLNARISSHVDLNETWFLPVGLDSQNLYLGSVPGVPVSTSLHTLSLNTGIGYRYNEQWMFLGLFNPTLYRFNHVGGKDIGFSGGLTAAWQYSPTVRWLFGVIVNPDSDVPALPIAGVDWQMSDDWELRLSFPQPRIIYEPNQRVNYYFGANIVDTTYRTSDTLGTGIGLTQYDNALATYRDIRIGFGVHYELTKSLSAEAEAGYSVDRQIRYNDVKETVKFDPAPYVRLGLNWNF